MHMAAFLPPSGNPVQITGRSQKTGKLGGVNIAYFPNQRACCMAWDVCHRWQVRVLGGRLGWLAPQPCMPASGGEALWRCYRISDAGCKAAHASHQTASAFPVARDHLQVLHNQAGKKAVSS